MRPNSFDVETYSYVDLKFGADRYTADWRTRCLMFAWHEVGGSALPRLWREGDPVPQEFCDYVASNGSFTGWNILFFDRLVYNRILVPRHGFPPIDDDNWKDSMHLAAAANLPRKLDACAKAVGVEHDASLKDSNRIRRITDANRTAIPAPAGEILDNPERFRHIRTTPEYTLVDDLQWLAARCVQDVLMEEQVLMRLPPWPSMQPWLSMPAIDRRINDRGVMIDLPLVQGLARAAAIETTRLDGEIAKITNGQVPRTTNIESLKTWLIANGVELPRVGDPLPPTGEEDEDAEEEDDDSDKPKGGRKSPWRLRKSDIADLLARTDVPEHCRLAVEMRAEAAKASTRKLKAMLASADANWRLKGALILMGAQATGRFSSHGWQAHNLVRDAFGKDYENIARQNGLDPKKDKAAVKLIAAQALRTAVEVGRTGDPDLIRAMFETERTDLQGRKRIEGVLPFVSRMMRRTICAPAGKLLLNGDFANIQARLPVWLAGQQETVDAFARGEDLYRIQASPVYGIPPDQLTSEQRQIGKVMRLFLGFAAGTNAFIPAAMIYGILISREQGAKYVDLFRATNQPLVTYWDNNLNAAKNAVMYPGYEFPVGPTNYVSWFMQENCLCLRLPSGRLMRYWAPLLEQQYWQDGSPKMTLDLTVLVVKGRAVFRRTLWRGLAIQNLVCAIEADILCVALKNMDEAGILPAVLHVHDNIAAEVPEERAQDMLPVFKQCMLAMPEWTKGLPVAVDADASARFG